MAATIGVASALARTATPPPSGVAPTDTELVLGYDICRSADLPATAHRLAFRLDPGRRGHRRRGAVSGRRAPAAPARRQLAGRPHGGLGRRLRDGAVRDVVRARPVRRGAVLDPHDGAHAARHDRADPAGARRPGHAGAAGAAGRRSRRGPRAAGAHRGRTAQPAGALHHPPAGRLPAVHPVVLRAVLHLAVRGDDRLAPRSPGDEPAFPGRRLPVLLGDHRGRSVAAAGAADGQAGHVARRVAVPRVLRARPDELAQGDGRPTTTTASRCPGSRTWSATSGSAARSPGVRPRSR